MTIADKINNNMSLLITGFLISARITSDNPFCEMIPKRAAISCKTIVATIDKTMAHNKLNPKLTPANVQTVTVPGPINAAATNVPGPIFFKRFLIILRSIQCVNGKASEPMSAFITITDQIGQGIIDVFVGNIFQVIVFWHVFYDGKQTPSTREVHTIQMHEFPIFSV